MTTEDSLFDIGGKRIAITGGAGVLGREMCISLAARGAKICIVDYNDIRANELAKEIEASGGFAIPVRANVLEKESLEEAFVCAAESLGGLDVLINGAGGNKKEATCTPQNNFFDLPADALRWVLDLNCLGTILPSQVFGRAFAQQKYGTIVNIASMNAFRPLTNIAAYSAAKAAIKNFTEWLATYMAMNFSPEIRVNGIAPGFFISEQNRFLLTDLTSGQLTPRGQQVIAHTPMHRFGNPTDLVGTLIWLISDASKFVTGVTVPVDGGFNAYSGV